MWLLGQQEHILSSRTQAGGSRGPTRGRKRRWVQVWARPVGLEQNGPCQERTGRWPGGSWGPGAGRGGGLPPTRLGMLGLRPASVPGSHTRPLPGAWGQPGQAKSRRAASGRFPAWPQPAGHLPQRVGRAETPRARGRSLRKGPQGPPQASCPPTLATFPQVGWAPGARAHGGRPSLRSLLPLPEARLYTVLGSSSSRRDKGRGSRSHFHHKPGQAPALGAVLRTGGKVP